jgi:glutamine cyclotransferase
MKKHPVAAGHVACPAAGNLAGGQKENNLLRASMVRSWKLWLAALALLGGLISLWLFIQFYGQEEVVEYRVQVLAEYPHDSEAFTQGLLLQNGRLFESTGLYSKSSVREVDLETGNIERIKNLSGVYFGEGLAAYGNQLYQLTWQNGAVLIYDRDTFEQTGQANYSGQGWGLCQDGQRFIMSNGSSSLFFRSLDTFESQGSIGVTLKGSPVRDLNELEYVDGYVYANVWKSDYIVQIDPGTGKVVGRIDASGLLSPEERRDAEVLNGIAYNPDSETFLVTGKLWPKLFEVRFIPK